MSPALKIERQRGGSRLKVLIGLLITVAIIYAAVKIVPVYVNNYQLQDAMQTEARFAGPNRKSVEDVRDDINREIQDLGLPARRDDIKVQSNQGIVRIWLDYTVPVDLTVYQLQLHFHVQADNSSI